MEVYVIRHGLTELNRKKILNGQIDEPLLPEGIVQAEAAADLVPDSVRYIYTSPMLRARQTARIISRRLHIPLLINDSLKEINMGDLAGKSWTDLKNGPKLREKHRSHEFDYRLSGGESAHEVKTRLIRFLREINEKHEDCEVLLVTHGGIIRILHLLESDKPLLGEMKNAVIETFDLDKILQKS